MVNKLEGDVFNYTEVRSNFKAIMDKVWDDSCPVIITRKGGRPVVMMSKEEYDSIKETEYLRASPANAERLREAMAEIQAGNTIPMKWDDKAGKFIRAN